MSLLRETLAGALGLFAFGMILTHCTGCTPAYREPIENAAAVIQYEALLDDCRKKGKAARDYDVYAECADAVDRTLCVQSGVRCVDGGRR